MITRKTITLTIQTFPSVRKVMSLLFNMVSRCVIAFLPRSKCLLISRLQSQSAVILEPKKIKSVTVSTFSPSICHEVMDAMISAFWILSFKPVFSLFHLHQEALSSSSFSAMKVVFSAYLRLVIFLLAILIAACASSSPVFHMMYSAYCCSHAFRETNSLRRTMQIVEGGLLHQWAQGRVSSWPRILTNFCENLIYPKCTCSNSPPQIP